MGLFDFFKNNKIPHNKKRELILDVLIARMVKFGAVDPTTKVRNHFSQEDLNEFYHLPDQNIFGFPEGSIITILETYWYYKLKKHEQDDSVIYRVIEKERMGVRYPRGIINDSLDKFIIYRLRLEQPLWSKENISDEELNWSIMKISDICDAYFSDML